MILILLVLIYWGIKLDKLRDYNYALKQYYKWIQQYCKKWQRSDQIKKHNDQAQKDDKFQAIDLDKDKVLN